MPKRFLITRVLDKCDCCGSEPDKWSSNYAVTTNSEIATGLILCLACLDALEQEIKKFLG
jgi:hypothetical protein